MNKATLGSIYQEALKKVDDKNVFQRDILFLMEEEFSINRNDIFINDNKEYFTEDFRKKLDRLSNGEPVEYIVNKAYFYKRYFYVNENTLIPRNETEELIEKTIYYLNKYNISSLSIVEVGSGSGCIAITLGLEVHGSKVDSYDISNGALEVASINNDRMGTHVSFYRGDCLKEAIKKKNKYDLIISNPPYIDRDTYVQESVKMYEPELALYADNHGLAIYEELFMEIPLCAKEKCLIALEISPDLKERLSEIAIKYLKDYKFWFEKDMNGFVRFMFLIKE